MFLVESKIAFAFKLRNKKSIMKTEMFIKKVQAMGFHRETSNVWTILPEKYYV